MAAARVLDCCEGEWDPEGLWLWSGVSTHLWSPVFAFWALSTFVSKVLGALKDSG